MRIHSRITGQVIRVMGSHVNHYESFELAVGPLLVISLEHDLLHKEVALEVSIWKDGKESSGAWATVHWGTDSGGRMKRVPLGGEVQ